MYFADRRQTTTVMIEMNHDGLKRIYRYQWTGRGPLDFQKQIRDLGSRGARLMLCTRFLIVLSFVLFCLDGFLCCMSNQSMPRLSLGHENERHHMNRCWNKSQFRCCISSNLQKISSSAWLRDFDILPAREVPDHFFQNSYNWSY